MFRKCVFCLAALWLFAGVAAAEPSISSASGIVYLPETGQVLYEKDADTARPMASTTKLMTALVAAERLDMDAELVVPAQAVLVEGSSLGLRGGDRITVQDLLTGMLLASGNDAANTVALSVSDSLPAFAELMNDKAAQLGMTHSCFVTPSGLDAAGHAASARDMALLAGAVLENDTLAAICATRSVSISFGNPPTSHVVSNHNKLLTRLEDCIGLKTGYTTKSGRCLVSAVHRNDITLVAVTLNGHDYWNDHQALYDYAFAQVQRAELPTVEPPKLTISGGLQEQAALCYEPPAAPILPAGEEAALTAVMELPPFVLAPVEAGDTVGYISYRCGETELCRVPLQAADTVAARPVAAWWIQWQRSLWELLQALG